MGEYLRIAHLWIGWWAILSPVSQQECINYRIAHLNNNIMLDCTRAIFAGNFPQVFSPTKTFAFQLRKWKYAMEK